jgi:hypothetical protein
MFSISISTASPTLSLCDSPLAGELDLRALGSKVLAHERPKRLHRPAELTPEHGAELLRLLIGSSGVDEHAETPVPLGHHLRRVGDGDDREPAHVDASISPESTWKARMG